MSFLAALAVTASLGAALARIRPLGLGSEPTPLVAAGSRSRMLTASARLAEPAKVLVGAIGGLLAVTAPVALIVVGALLGLAIVGRRRAAGRQERARSEREAIDAMTMLDVCLSAGLGLRESVIELDRLTAAPLWRSPAAALERGVGFAEVMGRLGRDEPALNRSAMAMARAHRDGGSVRAVVRGHRDDLVRRRRSETAERSQQLGVLVLLPLTLCILPALVLAVVVPIAADGLTGLSFPL